MNDPESRQHEATASAVDDAAELGGRMIASLTDSKVLEHTPVVKWGVSIFRAISCVRDMLLARRIGSFMHAVKDGLESWEVEDTISRLAASRHYAESVGEHLVERLERIEGRRKALMTAAAFVALGKKSVDENEFYRLLHAIEVVHLPDLPSLRNFAEEGPVLYNVGNTGRKFNPTQESLQSLSAASLVHSIATAPIGGSQPGWFATNLGSKFIELRLDLIEYKED